MKRCTFCLAGLAMLIQAGCGFFGGGENEKPRVFYINSYHEGYAASDETMQGIKDSLSPLVDLRIFFMDSKQNPGEDFAQQKAEEAMAILKEWKPNVVIVSDDTAVKYLVEPHWKNGPIPVVFCGVNWNCDQYGLPTDFVTGMLEVLPLEELLTTWKTYDAEIRKITVLSENTLSEQNNKTVLDPLYTQLGFEASYALVDTFEEWKQAFLRANADADLIYVPTNGAIQGWNHEEARQFIHEHIKKPVCTCDDFMMPYAVLGFTKVAREQGEWAAQAALDLLLGKSPKEIPVAKNKQTAYFFNSSLAEKIGFLPDADLLTKCRPVR